MLPAGHTHIAGTLNNLASLLHDQVRLPEAEPLYREAIEIERAAGDAEALFHAFSLNNLGSLLEDLGRYDEAAPLYRRSLEIRRLRLGEGASTLKMRSKLGRLAVHSGRLDDAERLLTDAEAWYDEHAEPGDGDRLRTIERLALLRRAQGDAEASTALLRQALDEATASYPADHRIHVELGAELAWSLAESTEPARCLDAVDAARSVLAARSAAQNGVQASTQTGDDIAQGRLDLADGLCLRAVGRGDEAVASLRSAVEGLAPALGEANHWVRAARSALDS